MFKTAKLDNTKPIRAIFYTLWKYQKGITHYIKERPNASKLTKQEKLSNLHIACDEYVNRMNGNIFHGGETPDAVDFRLYSVLDRVKHTSMIIGLFKAREEDQRFQQWFNKMSSLCEKKSTFWFSHCFNLKFEFKWNRKSAVLPKGEPGPHPPRKQQEQQSHTNCKANTIRNYYLISRQISWGPKQLNYRPPRKTSYTWPFLESRKGHIMRATTWLWVQICSLAKLK